MHAAHRFARLVPLAVAGAAVLLSAGCMSSTGGPGTPSGQAGGAPRTSASGPAPRPGSGPSSGSASGGGSASPAATLRITTLRAGQTITLPATIGYRVAGSTIDPSTGYQVRVRVANRTVDLPITARAGTIRLPVNKFLAGRRDLTFTLVGPGGSTHAVVVIPDVTIVGPR